MEIRRVHALFLDSFKRFRFRNAHGYLQMPLALSTTFLFPGILQVPDLVFSLTIS
jgi:hypothetical protein